MCFWDNYQATYMIIDLSFGLNSVQDIECPPTMSAFTPGYIPAEGSEKWALSTCENEQTGAQKWSAPPHGQMVRDRILCLLLTHHINLSKWHSPQILVPFPAVINVIYWYFVQLIWKSVLTQHENRLVNNNNNNNKTQRQKGKARAESLPTTPCVSPGLYLCSWRKLGDFQFCISAVSIMQSHDIDSLLRVLWTTVSLGSWLTE